jgi:hypothetical protein
MFQSVNTTYIQQEQGYVFRLQKIAITKPELQDAKSGFYSCNWVTDINLKIKKKNMI